MVRWLIALLDSGGAVSSPATIAAAEIDVPQALLIYAKGMSILFTFFFLGTA